MPGRSKAGSRARIGPTFASGDILEHPIPSGRRGAVLALALALASGCAGRPAPRDAWHEDPGRVGPDLPGDLHQDVPQDPWGTDPGTLDADPAQNPWMDIPGDIDAGDPAGPDEGDLADRDSDSGREAGPDDSADPASEVPESCPPWPFPVVVGNLDGTGLAEASGLAASRVHRGILWSHNDSGDSARVFAIRLPDRPDGEAVPGPDAATEVTAFPLEGVRVTDCEDIAIGPFAGTDRDALFLADTGDNAGSRTVLSVYVFPEPSVIDGAAITDVRRIDVSYPDGPHDCESLFVDPWTGDLYFVVKETVLETTQVFRLPAPAADVPAVPAAAIVLDPVARFPFAAATAADMSPDGLLLAVRGYFGGGLFRREPGQSVADMLATGSCDLPGFLEDPYDETQGEALAFDANGTGFYTVSERLLHPQDIHYTAIP